jgi:hypothetical protein
MNNGVDFNELKKQIIDLQLNEDSCSAHRGRTDERLIVLEHIVHAILNSYNRLAALEALVLKDMTFDGNKTTFTYPRPVCYCNTPHPGDCPKVDLDYGKPPTWPPTWPPVKESNEKS